MIEEIKEAVVQLKAIEQIPKSSRLPIHDTEFLQHLNTIRAGQLEFFSALTKARFDQCSFLFNFTDGCVQMDFGDSDIDARLSKIGTPKIPEKNLTTDQINELIVDIENALSSVYGGLEELKPIQTLYDTVYRWAENVYKGLCLSNHEWEGAAVFAMLVPEDYMTNKLYLDMLVSAYQVKLEGLQSTYEKLSRMVALRLMEPGEIQRGQKDFSSTDFSRKKK